jgi:hypothetical protein
MNAEGWYQDPFSRHEARWISDGTPTALVRDGEVESQDPPPSATFDGELQPLAESEPPDGEDLLRADAAESGDHIFDPNAAVGAVWDDFGVAGGGD